MHQAEEAALFVLINLKDRYVIGSIAAAAAAAAASPVTLVSVSTIGISSQKIIFMMVFADLGFRAEKQS